MGHRRTSYARDRQLRKQLNVAMRTARAPLVLAATSAVMDVVAADLHGAATSSSSLVRRCRSTEIVQYTAELVWRSPSMLSEEAREIALDRKSVV